MKVIAMNDGVPDDRRCMVVKDIEKEKEHEIQKGEENEGEISYRRRDRSTDGYRRHR